MFVSFIGKKDDILFHFVLKYSFKFVVSDDLKIDFFQKWNFLKFRIKKYVKIISYNVKNS